MADAKQVVERHIDAFNAHQADADPWAEDAEFVAPGASMRGREDVLGFLGRTSSGSGMRSRTRPSAPPP
jgi:hypothetical protein